MTALPPHPRFEHSHPKSVPLMLKTQDVDAFQDLLRTRIPVPLEVTPIDSPQTLNPVGEPERIDAE